MLIRFSPKSKKGSDLKFFIKIFNLNLKKGLGGVEWKGSIFIEK